MPSALALTMAKVHKEGGLWSCVQAKASVKSQAGTAEVRQTIETSDDMLD